MRVIPVAYTMFNSDLVAQSGYIPHENVPYDPEYLYPSDSDELAEFAGRLCYKSWNRPNPDTATNEGYLNNIIKQKHFSVLEHGSASFYIDGVSRSLTHELVRHRHLSFSQVSQRYVDESKSGFIVPPDLKDLLEEDFYPGSEFSFTWGEELSGAHECALEVYEMIVERLIDRGMSRKEARQAARSVLPNGTETAIVVTGNHRAWREVVEKRGNPHADREIQELAKELLYHLKKIAPNTYQDMEL